jgi:hypothetical protein
LQEAKTKMKRMVLLILVLLLMVDLAEDGFLGNAKVYLPGPSAETSVTSSHNHPGLNQADSRYELVSPDLPERLVDGHAQPVTLPVSSTLQIMYCCHVSSSGGIPF